MPVRALCLVEERGPWHRQGGPFVTLLLVLLAGLAAGPGV